MSHHRVIYYSTTVLALAICLVLVSRGAAASPPPQPQGAVGSLYVVLNEVMAKPTAGQPAWVELLVGQDLQSIYLPTIQKQTTSLDPIPAVPVSLPPAILPVLDLRNWQVSNEAGQLYNLPSTLPLLPKNTFVLILFDGTGPTGNDTDFSDGRVTLHTPPGLLDIFADEFGQVALHRPGTLGPATLVDFVAWGGFDETSGANAVTAGKWGAGEAVSLENGFGDIDILDVTERNESIGRYPGAKSQGALNWTNYPPASLSPGAANPIPPVLFITPESGALVDTATLSLSWRRASGATQYHFQLDNNADFSSPLIDQFTANTYFKPSPALAPGTYHWRINPLRGAQAGGWSAGFTIQVVNLLSPDPSGSFDPRMATTADVVLGIARVSQNKDSRLLGLDGAPEGDPSTDLPENAWDSAAPCVSPPCTDSTKYMHGNMYCVRASVRMVASYYHTSAAQRLSMDRISYYVIQEWAGNTRPGTHDSSPDNDLGFNRGMYYPDEEDRAFSWALNFTHASPGGKPSFATVKAAIDAQQPIMFRRPGHMMVIDGYRETAGGGQFLHILDPDQPPDFERWQDYSTQGIDGYWIGRTGGPATGVARTDENSMWTDTDGDGIMNFDEVLRFGLNPLAADSDGDWVTDKKDMREYVFNNSGAYSIRSSDSDGDGLRKEKDPDNDNDGSPDSCEDVNRNGKYESTLGETDNFSASSHQACVPYFDLLYPLKSNPVNVGDHTNPQKILVQVATSVPQGWSLSLTPDDFGVVIGSQPAAVLAVYTAADTTFLVVQPPVQTSNDLYDLEVKIGSFTDTEPGAVLYEPKFPNDEVIVLDRSGSMTTNDKIGAAKNAASAFVDFLSVSDWVGVTSFATTSSSDYPLHEITAGSSVRADAITAIYGLVADGTTALGQGMQRGQKILEDASHFDHDWTLVLLSDGWENVAPYWATVAPDIVKSVVHTVALGSDADTFLLQKIALSKYGTYFYVDVNPPPPPPAPVPAVPSPVLITKLPNRLADTYLAIGEWEHGMQRLFELVMPFTKQYFELDIPKGVPEVIFGLNWNNPSVKVTSVVLTGPDGKPVTPSPVYEDKTHLHMHVVNPDAGTWGVSIQVEGPSENELYFTLSGRSETTLQAAVGGDPQKRGTGTPVPIYGILTDNKPIPGASVVALVSGGGGSKLLQLYDDGSHGDGKKDDGVYANTLTGLSVPGGYSVKLTASGANNEGEPFLRHANTAFNVRPRLAYIFKDRLDVAVDYAGLLEDHNWVVDLIPLPEVTQSRLQAAQMIIIGPDTGYTDAWGTPDALKAVIGSERPVVGLGEGGYAYFGKLTLSIGYPHGAHGEAKSIRPVNTGDAIWGVPYDINPGKEPVQLYNKASPSVEINIINTPLDVILFGQHETSNVHYNLLQENNRYMLWGFDDGPRRMTENGRRMFINTVFRNLH